MRLIAVPLARVRPGAQPVATFLAQRAPPVVRKVNPAPTTAATPQASQASTPDAETKEQPLSTRLLNKASDFWLALGRDGEDGKKLAVLDWKRRTYNFGEKMMDRIEYEEWALKAVDPALGPKVTSQNSSPPATDPLPTIQINYPPSLISAPHLLSNLRNLVGVRAPHHRSRMIWCVVGMPFTIPFMLVPVVPNLPFFYLVWRAYSHMKAYRSSVYLRDLLAQDRIVPFSDSAIDAVFQQTKIADADSSSSPTSANTTGQLILTKDHVEALKKVLDLNQQSYNELVRARQQTEASIQKGELTKLEQAAEGYQHTSEEEQVKKDQ